MFLKMPRLLFDTPTPPAEGTPPAQSMLGDTPPAKAPPATPPAAATPPATPPANGGNTWLATLPAEMQTNPSLAKFTSAEALAGSYLNAVKMIGADKIAVPNKHTTPEEFRQILHKIGLPQDLKDYSIKFKEGVSLEDKVSKEYAEFAHKTGILPAQAQAIADWLSDASIQAVNDHKAASDRQFNEASANLKKEWGNAYELNISRATKALKDIGGEDLAKYFTDSGLAGDVNVVKFLAKTGELLFAEHKFVDGQGTPAGMSPLELDKKITELQTNPAYFDKHHPNHKNVVAEVQSLYQQKFPVDKA